LHPGCARDFSRGFSRTIARLDCSSGYRGAPTTPRTGLAPAGVRDPGGLFHHTLNSLLTSFRAALTIFDEWGRKKRHHLEVHGYKVDVLVERDISEKKISATEVRDRILKDRNWRELVPESTHTILESMNMKDRIRKLKELAL
jgi:hypothetical protein